MAPQKEIVLKLTSMRYKAANVSDKEFYDYISMDHARKAAEIQQRHGALRVEHYCTPKACRDLIQNKATWALAGPEWKLDDHDVQTSYFVRSLDQATAIVSDPAFQTMAVKDCEMQDNDRATIIAGWVEVYVEDNKLVNFDDEGRTLYSQPFEEKIKVIETNGATKLGKGMRF